MDCQQAGFEVVQLGEQFQARDRIGQGPAVGRGTLATRERGAGIDGGARVGDFGFEVALALEIEVFPIAREDDLEPVSGLVVGADVGDRLGEHLGAQPIAVWDEVQLWDRVGLDGPRLDQLLPADLRLHVNLSGEHVGRFEDALPGRLG